LEFELQEKKNNDKESKGSKFFIIRFLYKVLKIEILATFVITIFEFFKK